MGSHVAEIEEINRLAVGKRKVFVSGNFNVIHSGHLRLLRFAREAGEFLIVGVNKNPNSSSPTVSVPAPLRFEGIRSLDFVDYALILESPPADFIRELRPEVVVKGREHETRYNPEEGVLSEIGSKLLFGSGEHSFSTIDLIRSEFQEEINLSTIRKPGDFLHRHNIAIGDLRQTIEKFKELNICVIGDAIIDEYIACEALGMSQEDPTIVVTPLIEEKFIGGAGIVAAHARGLGARVTFLTVTGDDATAKYLGEKCEEYLVEFDPVVDKNRPTTLKQRYRAGGKTLLRVSHLRQHDMNADLIATMFEKFRTRVERERLDLLVFSDFNYGCLPQKLVEAITEICIKQNIPMVADSQSSSQIGDVSRFQNLLFLTPTEREARLALRDFRSGLVVVAEELRTRTRSQSILVTLGSEGLLIHTQETPGSNWITDRLPAFNTAPKDISGAGDSLLTVASMSSALGRSIWHSAYLGSLSAACQVGQLGNVPLAVEDLFAELDYQ